MAKRVGVDKWLFGTVLLLVLFGLVSVFSASAVLAKATLGSPYAYVMKQAGFALAGMVALFVLMRVDYRKYNNPKLIFPLMGITGLLLLAVFAWRRDEWGASVGAVSGDYAGAFGAGEADDRAVPGVVSADADSYDRQFKETILPAVIPPLLFIALILKEPDLGTGLVCAGGDDVDAVPGGVAGGVDRDGSRWRRRR